MHQEDSQDSAYSPMIYYSKRYKVKSEKAKGTLGTVQMKLPEFSTSRITQDMLHSSNNKLWKHVRNWQQANLLREIRCPRFLLGAGHIGILCPAHIKVLNSHEESRCVQHKPLFVQFRPSEPLSSVLWMVEMMETLPKSKFPSASQGLSRVNSQAFYVNSFLHSDFCASPLSPCNLHFFFSLQSDWSF